MAQIRVKEWFIKKNNLNTTAEAWHEIKGATAKAYKTAIGWIPKSCIDAYDDSAEASLLADEEYKNNILFEGEAKYYIKEGWVFNLEAMWDKLWLIAHEAKDEDFPMVIGGYICRNAEEVMDVREWSEELHSWAFSRKVTGKAFAEIKKIVNWRVMVRYNTCVAAGMNENDAGRCFEDL